MSTAIPVSTRRAVADRSGGTCEICGHARATQVHHRRPRGMGGTSHVAVHRPACCLHLCGGCHNRIERDRTYAITQGWLVPAGTDPAAQPVRLWHGWSTFLPTREDLR